MRACIEYMEPFRPSGLVEMEFIRRQDRFYLLDVNPRFSATLRLNAVASRSNPMTDLIAAACGEGQLGERVRVERHALEWPLNHTVDSGVREQLAGCDDVWISTRVTLAAPDEASLAARVAEVRATLAP